MIKDAAYGIVPVVATTAPQESPWRYLLILHNKGHWGFPKGHADPGETELETAQRELQEETGLTHYSLIPEVQFREHYQFVNPKGLQVDKTVLYYLAWIWPQEGGGLPQVTIQTAELADYRWCPYQAALELITFEASRSVLQKCEAYLVNQQV